MTNREAALSPPSSDSLVAFAGDYVTYVLPEKEGYPATQTRSLSIAVEKDGEPFFGLVHLLLWYNKSMKYQLK